MTATYHVHMENSNFDEALKIINSEIKIKGVKPDLIQAKIFCLINLNKFTLALSTIHMNKDLNFGFDEAYCNYRLGKFISALNSIKESVDPRSELLKAQILCRLERFEESSNIFESLIKSEQFPVEELQVNLMAARSQNQGNEDLSQLASSSFDSMFNLALVKLASKDFKGAEQLATECYDKFAFDENVNQADIINSQLLAICARMNDKNNWPEAEFLLRKLKTSISLTPAQGTLIDANLMAISEKKNIVPNFNINDLEKLKLFGKQKLQILANAHNFGFKLSKSQLKLVKDPNSKPSMNCNTTISCFYDHKLLKNDTKASIKTEKKEPAGIDKERWLPLRDRSYYKPKAQYLKSKKNKVTKK